MERSVTVAATPPVSTLTIPFGRPQVGDAELTVLADVLASGVLTQGPLVRQFEDEFAAFTNAPHALATSSCMGALHLAYLALGLRSGDEVIVPAQTHVATAMAVEVCGGRCVFVDVDAETGNIDLSRVQDAITPRTRGITLVHFLGLPVDMRALRTIADAHHLFVVEDCALALGATCDGIHVGLWGDAGAFSFYPAKHISTGEGGMLTSRRADVAKLVRAQRAFGVDRSGPGVRPDGVDYDVTGLGLNYRMSELSGALGVCQMTRLPGILAARAANFAQLTGELQSIAGITLMRSSHDHLQSSWYCLSFFMPDDLADRRDELAVFLRARGIGSSVYYPRPVPQMSFFRERYAHDVQAFPNAARISRQSIALPVGPHLGQDQMAIIAQGVRDGVAALRR